MKKPSLGITTKHFSEQQIIFIALALDMKLQEMKRRSVYFEVLSEKKLYVKWDDIMEVLDSTD